MKRRIITIFAITALLFSSCGKEDNKDEIFTATEEQIEESKILSSCQQGYGKNKHLKNCFINCETLCKYRVCLLLNISAMLVQLKQGE